MKITILCSSEKHPVNNMLTEWIHRNNKNHDIQLARKKTELSGGDLLFLISCSEIISIPERNKFKKTLIVHASDLPQGRGWSPHVWEIINGAMGITVSLLEAEDNVDSGDIWKKLHITIPPHALHDEINDLLFTAEAELMDYAVDNFFTIHPQKQSAEIEATYYPRRTESDSELDPHNSISSQFGLIRVCDPARFPAFFMLHGHKYKLTLEKVKDE
ncbi:formyltransferase family protein [Aeromonas bivalvium]|uniref:formyltransferase family protein n=1 Tax=Aeromonas bivalvium TaxID=440079 RepID=UPI0009FC18F9|nr:formyltransferase family protein [Aeromonas bivalvium]